MIEGITLLGLAWREPHKPITLTSVLDVSLGVSIILFSVLGYFIRCLLELIEDIARVGDKHIYFTGKIIETLAETAGDAEQEAHKS